jgi:deoxyadenosine/deoxycytidine kinase
MENNENANGQLLKTKSEIDISDSALGCIMFIALTILFSVVMTVTGIKVRMGTFSYFVLHAVVEGIFALVNKKIRELSDLNIFINASSENRFLRRLKRDQEERGRTFEYVVNQYVNVVAPAYEEIIAPTKMFADLIVSNDGIENKSLEILASIFNMMLEK